MGEKAKATGDEERDIAGYACVLGSAIEPILNPILVAVVVGETIGPLSLFGAVLVIGGAVAYNVRSARGN